MAIALDSTTRSLTVVLAGAKTSLDAQFIATYEDRPVSPALGNTALAVPFTNQGTTNGVTAAVVMPSPAGLPAYRRVLKSLQFNNVDTGAITVTFNFVDTAGSTTKLVTFVLQTGEYIGYEDGYGFDVFDVNGALKSQNANTSAATSTAQAAGSQASSMASIALLGSSQASSLASGIVIASVNSVSSQASSMTALVPASVSSNASLGTLGSSQCSSLLARWSVTVSKTSSSFSF